MLVLRAKHSFNMMNPSSFLFGRKFVNLVLLRHAVAVTLILSTFITSTATADPLGYRATTPLTPSLHVRPASTAAPTWGASSQSLRSLQTAPSLSQGFLHAQGASGTSFLGATEPGPPSSGLGFIISGWILTGVGALNVATMPLCFTSYYVDAGVKGVCLGISAAFIGVGLGVGIPFLIVGYNQRKKYKAWRDSHAVLEQLDRTRLTVLPGGAAALYSAEF